jgi:hypothetical protein
MTDIGKGRADYLELGDYNAVCYQCGRKRKASTMKKHWQGYWVCPEHWEPRHPQDFVRGVPDPQTPPWAQPMPTDIFVGGFCTTIIAVAGEAVAGCSITDWPTDSRGGVSTYCTGNTGIAGYAVADCAIAT